MLRIICGGQAMKQLQIAGEGNNRADISRITLQARGLTIAKHQFG